MKWIHKLLNPHCEHCIEEAEKEREAKLEDKNCKTCDVLQIQLAIANDRIKELLEKLTEKEVVVPPVSNNFVPVRSNRFTPFSVQRREREREDRVAADKLRKREKEISEVDPNIDKLEESIGVKDASSGNT